jgi:hypothetical protein
VEGHAISDLITNHLAGPPKCSKKVLGEPRFALVQPIREPEFAFRVIVNYRLESVYPESFRTHKKGGKVDGAILDNYALKNGA